MGVSSELEIQIYRVDDFDHHVPEPIDQEFKEVVKKAGKQYQSINDYETLSDSHEEACNNNLVEDNRPLA